MKRLMQVSPTGSYQITIPTDVQEETDQRVRSYWRSGADLLLQVSSSRRRRGRQVGAAERLRIRLGRGYLRDVVRPRLAIPGCPDQASAMGLDAYGLTWLYCYCVWPDLTVFAKVSSKGLRPDVSGNWAIEALESIRRTPQ